MKFRASWVIVMLGDMWEGKEGEQRLLIRGQDISVKCAFSGNMESGSLERQ